MRKILYTISMIGLGAGLSAAAEPSVTTTCDRTLGERMLLAADKKGECRVTITEGDRSWTKTFRASVIKDSDSEAKLMLRETCEACGDKAPTHKLAMDFSNLTRNIIQASNEQLSEPTEADPTPTDACAAPGDTKSDVMSCRIATLTKQTDADDATLYFDAFLRPEMQKLAQSKVDADQTLLRQTVLTLHNNLRGVVAGSRAVIEAIDQFNHFVDYRANLARVNIDLEINRNNPPKLVNVERAKRDTQMQAEAFFTNRLMFLRQANVKDDAAKKNAELLLGALKQNQFSGSTGPSASSTDLNGRAGRGVGTPAGMPSGGFAPRKANGSPFNPN